MTLRTLAIGFLVSGIVGFAASAEGPRPHVGSVYVVEITLPNPGEDVDRLSEAGFSVSSLNGHVATVHATVDELLWLKVNGYSFTVVERQPNPFALKGGAKALGEYHSYADMTALLQAYEAAYGASQSTNPDICRLYSLGQSVQGRELWAMLITDNPDAEELEPEFKYVSTIHGDETVGTEMCLYFIDHLLTQYGVTDRISQLVDGTALWVVPLMNPDGHTLGSRYNANGFDLNRSFPSWPSEFSGTKFDGAPLDLQGRPPEVQHVMQWTADNSFTLSANFHAGALIVNYPFDDDGKGTGNDAPTPDDALLEYVSETYSMFNTPLYTSSVPYFPKGIANGSTWYQIDGGMQDWNYRYVACNEVTIELSVNKSPNAGTLAALWDDNRDAMIAYAEMAGIGVRGRVRDELTNEPVYARVEVAGNGQPAFTDPGFGDYHRMLLPGTYTLEFTAPGYIDKQKTGIVVTEGGAVRVDVKLTPLVVTTDINGDGQTNVSDVQLVVLAILGNSIAYDPDANGDGVVDTVDLQIVVNGVIHG